MGTEYLPEPVTQKPKFSPPGQEPCAQAQCQYCKRYGPLGSCAGCGAPTAPVNELSKPLTEKPLGWVFK